MRWAIELSDLHKSNLQIYQKAQSVYDAYVLAKGRESQEKLNVFKGAFSTINDCIQPHSDFIMCREQEQLDGIRELDEIVVIYGQDVGHQLSQSKSTTPAETMKKPRGDTSSSITPLKPVQKCSNTG